MAILDGVVELDRDGRAVRERRERRTQTRLGQDGRVDAVGQFPELTETGLHVGQRVLQQEPGLVVRFGRGVRVRQSDVIGQGQEPLLRAIVEIPLEQASFRVAGLDYPRPGRADLAELEQHLRLEPLVFQAEPDGWPELPLELGKRRGVADHRAPRVLLDQHGDQAPGRGDRLGDRTALRIHIALDGGEPVGDTQLRITERPRERRLQGTGSGRLAEVRHDTCHAAAMGYRRDGVRGQPGREQGSAIACISKFAGTPSYPPHPRWAVVGRYVPFGEPRPTTVGAAVDGLQHVYDAPGRIEFELDGSR